MYQKMEIIGRLGRKPEMKYTPSGQPVTKFSVATDNQYKNSAGETVKETIWFNVSVWGNMAEACNTYLDKGKLVFVEGRMTADKATGAPRIWNKNDGTPATAFEVVAQTVKFLSSKDASDSAPASVNAPSEEEIPF